MGYVNFKEEVYVAKEQLEKRKNNNQKIIKEMHKNRTLAKEYSPYEKYSYKEFKKQAFGKQGVEDEQNFILMENKDIICSKFINCRFSNIKFKNCNFIGCIFEECDFLGGGVSFDGCTFIKSDSNQKPSLNRKDNFSCYLKGCSIYPKFVNCDLSYLIFENCLIKNASFQKTDMISIIIYKSELNMVTVEDCDLSGIKIFKTYISDLEFNDRKRSKLDEKSFFDKIPIRNGSRNEYEGIYMVYQNIADKFKDNTLNNNFGEYYFLGKNTQRKTLDFLPKLESFLYFVTCGYGERPIYALIFSLVLIVIFAFLYLITGLEVDGHTIGLVEGSYKGVGLREFFTYFNESINLSVGMFAGMGINKATPDTVSYSVANVEMITGVIMMGVGIGTLTRKIIR
ncbi:pentapeptide repeat-containing protein [Clostridium cylindrosporum]|uniref:Pentapeptide repeats family protein n=1 Tax=Clostridium cylindrosporum DSM 605 TaxID=1121307 RepID=A0A0J8FZZ6_CLOCY|nr:pentapeptide repeat-containing protein [Clostridium cylindrosporum]KMT21126.1 pentapeptide repeats family protein [Clostridium cylindrosporum DSM 605]